MLELIRHRVQQRVNQLESARVLAFQFYARQLEEVAMTVALLLLRGVDNSKSQDFRAARAGQRLYLTGGVEKSRSVNGDLDGLGWELGSLFAAGRA